MAKEIIADLGYKKYVLDEATSAYAQNEDSNTGSMLVTTCSVQE